MGYPFAAAPGLRRQRTTVAAQPILLSGRHLPLPRRLYHAARPPRLALAGTVMQGKVLLENVRVKESAFERFGLPLAVKSGSVGKLELTIPWGSLQTRPVGATAALARSYHVLLAFPRPWRPAVERRE